MSNRPSEHPFFGEVISVYTRAQALADGDFDRRLSIRSNDEIQILADHSGNTVYLGERECSIQRRYQKILAETPSPAVDAGLRDAFMTYLDRVYYPEVVPGPDGRANVGAGLVEADRPE